MVNAEEQCTHLANINIWNEEDTYNLWYSRAEELLSENAEDYQQAKIDLGNEIQEYYRNENNPLADHKLVYSDLLGFALACVDWYEIASDFLETVKENK